MVVLFIALLVLIVYGAKFSHFHRDYMSVSSSNAIKGIFALIILYSHMRGYVQLEDSFWDQSYISILNGFGQLMVAMYLFYSGFGVAESMKHKSGYMATFPKKRIVRTLLHFDLAVLCYLMLMTSLGTYYPVRNYLFCWIGWESIGNSNWFIFVILALYVITYVSSFLFDRLASRPLFLINAIGGGKFLIVSFLSILLWLFLILAGKGGYWCDTIMTFPLGMFYSHYQSAIDKRLRSKSESIVLLLAVTSMFFAWRYYIGIDIFGFCSCLFCLMFAMITSKVKMDNQWLQWLGTFSFAIYIMQRFPMSLYSYLGLNANTYVFACLTIPSVIVLAWVFQKSLEKVDRRMF